MIVGLTAVNLLNIALMLLSLAVAMFVPFETFLIAYAILGPLHYLTQISWMHDRQYFTKGPRDGLVLTLLCASIATCSLIGIYGESTDATHTAISLMLLTFGMSLLFALTKDKALRWTGVIVFGAIALATYRSDATFVLIGMYVPTLIHVCVFTALFVLYGALKMRSWSAHASLLVFAACVLTALFFDPGTLGYTASSYATENYAFMQQVHRQLMLDSGGIDSLAAIPTGAAFFEDPASLQAARLIGFAYSYHYFNWFSKTSIIRWHEVPKARIAAIVALWIASAALYLIDFTTGIIWLLFLSYLHVVLEFPLDWRTFVGIGQELKARVTPTPATLSK